MAEGYDAASLMVPDATHFSLLGHEISGDEFLTLADDPAPAAVVSAILEASEDAG